MIAIGVVIVLAIVLVGVVMAKNTSTPSDPIQPVGDILDITLSIAPAATEGAEAALFVNGTHVAAYTLPPPGQPGSTVTSRLDLRPFSPVTQVTLVREMQKGAGKILVDNLTINGEDLRGGMYRASDSGGDFFFGDEKRQRWVKQGVMTWYPAMYRWSAAGIPQRA